MLVYRIVHKKYSDKFFASGIEGRWNSEGKKVIYTAESISLAYLETMAHRRGMGYNSDFKIMVIKLPSEVDFYRVNPNELSKNWRDFRSYKSCQVKGDKWYEDAQFLWMKVPSAVVPENCNVVINTYHKDFSKVKLVEVLDFVPDDRLEEIIKKYK
jgi:RES domain-containing protein